MPIDSITLTGTDLRVSRACFGTMTFGDQTSESQAARMIDECIDHGINFFDTANMYQTGVSEEILGRVLTGRRERVVLASKVRVKMGDGPDQQGLSKSAIIRAIDESLKRLNTDYLDLYYLHWPDYSVPLEETLAVLDSLVKQGKVRYPASSNYSSWQACRMLWLAADKGYTPIRVSQQMYNLLARGLESEFVPMAKEFGVSIIAYNPLAGGLLTGKHKFENITPGTRFDSNEKYQDRYWHREDFAAVEKLKAIAEEAGISMVTLSLSWLMHHSAADVVILGVSHEKQLAENFSALEHGALDPGSVEKCNQVWSEFRGPSPIYNR